ncbi:MULTISPECIES: YdiK family protein [Bacillus]|uniref:YdiK family protein n=1 Tax=Bacillus TaxID=1386 RepID=UPI000BB7D582|nr:MULTISPECIES: YdiK family protein [Bacillus]
MRITPIKIAYLYLVMGFLFLYIAIMSVGDTIWQFQTILLMLFATFNFGVTIRAFILHDKVKKMKEK